MGAADCDDIVALLLESNLNEEHGKCLKLRMSTKYVIEKCKLFYFVVEDTTSVFIHGQWLLSMHPSWQVPVREEGLEIFGKSKPVIEMA